MNCLICNSDAEYFFSKTYHEEPFKTFMQHIGGVDYYKCPGCGFTMSKTHYELGADQFEKLNFDYHTYAQKAKNDKELKGAPPYFEQAFMLNILSRNGIIDMQSVVDFAGGYGNLSNALRKYFDLQLPIYDPYIQGNTNHVYIAKESLGKYNTVISSALFEHVTNRETLDEINDLVSNDGCMIIHTVIAENVPKKEDWFYIRLPVHCSFHTNKSMEILMSQWNYQASIYCPAAKCWVLFKNPNPGLEDLVNQVNKESQTDYLFYKKGFVDYWKGFY